MPLSTGWLSTAAMEPERYLMAEAAAAAVVQPDPIPTTDEEPIGSGDDPVAHGDIERSKVAAEEVSAPVETDSSYRNANG